MPEIMAIYLLPKGKDIQKNDKDKKCSRQGIGAETLRSCHLDRRCEAKRCIGGRGLLRDCSEYSGLKKAIHSGAKQASYSGVKLQKSSIVYLRIRLAYCF